VLIKSRIEAIANLRRVAHLVLVLAFFWLAYWIYGRWQNSVDPQGEVNGYCFQDPIPAAGNGHGLVVSGHYTYCDVFGGSSAVYVHIRRADEPESKSTLVFRYFDFAGVSPPSFEWLDAFHVRISVGPIAEVTKQLPNAQGVDIAYTLGPVGYPQRGVY